MHHPTPKQQLRFSQGPNPKILAGLPAKVTEPGKSKKEKPIMTTSAPHVPNNGPQHTPHSAPAALVQEDQIKAIPLESIFADYAWNVRSRANVEDTAPEDAADTGFAGLMLAIATDGQDTPIIVRPANGVDYGGAKTDKPYALVSGFRRFTAIKRLNEITSEKLAARTPEQVKNENEVTRETNRRVAEAFGMKRGPVPNVAVGAIRATVRQLTDAQARLLNIRENTVRNDLDEPDIIHGIADLKNNYGGTQQALAQSLGKSQNFISQYFRISELPKEILKHWRNADDFQGVKANVRLDLKTMLRIHKLKDADKQIEAYKEELAKRTVSGEGKGEDADDRQWYDAAKKKIEAHGTMLARLAWTGFLKLDVNAEWKDQIDPKSDTLPDAMMHVGKANQEVSAKDLNNLAKAAKKAYDEETKRLQEEEDGVAAAIAAEQEAQGATGKGKGNKK
jgi:ParB-like chromosome segregation protein Spo0J